MPTNTAAWLGAKHATPAVGTGSAEACSDIVHACDGNKFVAMTSAPVSFETLPRHRGMSLQLPRLLLRLVSANVSLQVKTRRRHVRTKFIFGSTPMDNEVSRVIYEDFLPAALADGRYRAAPEPEVVGHGLESVRMGLDVQKKGVSARKVVVTL